MSYQPHANLFGGYSQNDGSVDFYGRINSVLNPSMTVVDLGAGRAEWFEDDTCAYRRQLRLIKGRVARVIALDVDPAVQRNRACDEWKIIDSDRLPLDDQSVDLLISDWVLEHIEDPVAFSNEVRRVLKPGGYFCARTPHKWCYWSVAARLVSNGRHSTILKWVQPGRKAVDIFPTKYRLNTPSDVSSHFHDFENRSFIYRSDPAYFFGSKTIYWIQMLLHRAMPSFFSGVIYVFLEKKRKDA